MLSSLKTWGFSWGFLFVVFVWFFLSMAYIVLSEELLLGDASRNYFLYIRSPKESKELKFGCCSVVV